MTATVCKLSITLSEFLLYQVIMPFLKFGFNTIFRTNRTRFGFAFNFRISGHPKQKSDDTNKDHLFKMTLNYVYVGEIST